MDVLGGVSWIKVPQALGAQKEFEIMACVISAKL